MFNELFAELPNNVYLKRLQKGWNNRSVMVTIADILGQILEPLLPRYQPIISFDTAPCHMHNDVWDVFCRHDLYWHLIPAKMTGLLQPLDTHGFLAFKRFMKQGELDMRLQENIANGFPGMVRLVVRGVREVLQGTAWLRAFQEDGICGHDSTVSRYIKRELQLETLPHIMPMLPTVAELQYVCPNGRQFDHAYMLGTQPGADGTVNPPSPAMSCGSEFGGALSDQPAAFSPSEPDYSPSCAGSSDHFLSDDEDLGGDDGLPPPPPALPAPLRRMNSKGPVKLGE